MAPAPQVLWAQRSSATEAEKNIVFLTIDVPELDPSYTLTITATSIAFSGHSTPPSATASASKVEPKTYEFALDFFAEVEVEEVKKTLSGKNLSLVLRKKEAQEEFWPRLTKEKAKLQFVKTDFAKWVDEDEQETVEEAPEEQGPPQGMGGPPGMGGMGGMGGPGGMDFASMMAGMGGGGAGGAGGAGGMDFEAMMAQMKASGMGGMGGMGGDDEEMPEEDDEDDDGPPPLEDA